MIWAAVSTCSQNYTPYVRYRAKQPGNQVVLVIKTCEMGNNCAIFVRDVSRTCVLSRSDRLTSDLGQPLVSCGPILSILWFVVPLVLLRNHQGGLTPSPVPWQCYYQSLQVSPLWSSEKSCFSIVYCNVPILNCCLHFHHLVVLCHWWNILNCVKGKWRWTTKKTLKKENKV